MIKIDTHVPMPKTENHASLYRKMRVGDSIWLDTQSCPGSVTGQFYGACKGMGRKFVARAEAGGVRVWRTK